MSNGATGRTLEEAREAYRGMLSDMAYSDDIFCEDDERTRLLKWVCQHRLMEGERIILFLYADCESVRELANTIGLARSTLFDEIQRIRRKVIEEMAKGYDA